MTQGFGPAGLSAVGDPIRFSTIAHRARTILGPLEPAELDGILCRMPVSPGDRVLDIGCGKGDLLGRLAAGGAAGIGLDRNAYFLDAARSFADAAGVGERLAFVLGDAAQGLAGLPRPFDLVACVGASGAIDGPEAAPAVLAELVRIGGTVLIGEGYWRVPPQDAWREAFGIEPGEMLDRDGCLDRMRAPPSGPGPPRTRRTRSMTSSSPVPPCSGRRARDGDVRRWGSCSWHSASDAGCRRAAGLMNRAAGPTPRSPRS